MLSRARGPRRALGARLALGVHLAVDEVSGRAIVAGVELGEPLAVLELGDAAAHLVGVGPHHGGVVADGGGELEGLHPGLVKQGDLFVPIVDRPLPVGRCARSALLVNVEVLSHHKSIWKQII